MLYTVEELKKDFTNFEFLQLEEVTTELKEGNHHVGKAEVIRLLARKL